MTMRIMSLRSAALAITAAVGLSGCSTYGLYGSPYGGASVGYGGYDPYYDGYGYGYSPYGYSPYGYRSAYYGSPYWGWYDDFYYPGTGYYVYDRYRRPHRWSDSQRDYWMQRQKVAGVIAKALQPNWNDFSRTSSTSPTVTTTTTRVRERTVAPRMIRTETVRERPVRTRSVRGRPVRTESVRERPSRFEATSDDSSPRETRRNSRRR
jgi:hypothetical protein